MRKLKQALMEEKYRVKMAKKGRTWMLRGMTLAFLSAGFFYLNAEKVVADSWQANSVEVVAQRIDYDKKQFIFTKGDTFWAVSRVLNIKYQTLMAWNGFAEGHNILFQLVQ